MSHKCVDIEDLGAIAELPPTSPERQAVESCPHCRALMASFASFLAAEKRPGSNPDEAAERLGAFLNDQIAARQNANVAEPTTRRFWHFLSGWKLAPVAAAAAVVVIALAVWQRPTGPALERAAGDGEAIELLGHQVSADTVSLTWSPFSDATGYRVVLYRPDLTELTAKETDGETVVEFDVSDLADAPNGQIIWRVFALVDGDEVARSAPAILQLP